MAVQHLADSERNWLDDKRLFYSRLGRCGQALAQKAVYCPLQGFTRAPHLLFDELGYIVIDGESSSHIMML